jgi:hypothetical protein
MARAHRCRSGGGALPSPCLLACCDAHHARCSCKQLDCGCMTRSCVCVYMLDMVGDCCFDSSKVQVKLLSDRQKHDRHTPPEGGSKADHQGDTDTDPADTLDHRHNMTPARRHCTPRCGRPCGQQRPGWTAACSVARCQQPLLQRHEVGRLVAGGLPASVRLGGVWPTHPASWHPQPESDKSDLLCHTVLALGHGPGSCCPCWRSMLVQPGLQALCWCTLVVQIGSKPRHARPDPRLYISKQFAPQLFAVFCFRYRVATLFQTLCRNAASATSHSVWCTAPSTLGVAHQ